MRRTCPPCWPPRRRRTSGWTASGYRGERQQSLLDWEVQQNRQAGMDASAALGEALRTVALPGHSEHQTGLALDFNDVWGFCSNRGL